jgi:hypothetical protein
VCRKILRQKLRAVGLFHGLFQESGFENFIDPTSTEEDKAAAMTCNKYRFSRKNSDAIDYRKHRVGGRRVKRDSGNSSNVVIGEWEIWMKNFLLVKITFAKF